MRVNKTFIALVIAASCVGAAHASQQDVDNVIAALQNASKGGGADTYTAAKETYQNLDADDRTTVDTLAEKDGYSGLLADIKPSVTAPTGIAVDGTPKDEEIPSAHITLSTPKSQAIEKTSASVIKTGGNDEVNTPPLSGEKEQPVADIHVSRPLVETVKATTLVAADTHAKDQKALTASKYASANAPRDGINGKDGVTTLKMVTENHTVVKHESDVQTLKAVARNTQSIERVQGEILSQSRATYAQAVTDSKSWTNQKFSELKSQVDSNKKDASAGTASAIAFASQPQVKTGDTFMVSAGAGTYDNESAVSVGASFNVGARTVLKAGVTADTQSNMGGGVGVGFSY